VADPQGRRRLVIVDDHPIVRLGIRQVIEAERDLEVCGEADSAPAALALVKQVQPELAVADLSLAEGNGLELIRALRESLPGLSILVISVHDEMLYAERVLRAGARGYIMKREAITGLIGAIRTVLAGRVYLSEGMAQAVLERLGQKDTSPENPLAGLTDRELEVFELIGRGLSTASIARQLGLSIKTVETYRSNIRTKLNLKDAAELVRFATTWTEGL
jgi:DNA-binding NarL/FixJ family response regulator